MKSKTRETLMNLMSAIQEIAQGTIHMIGVNSVVRITQVAEDAKAALDEEHEPNDKSIRNAAIRIQERMKELNIPGAGTTYPGTDFIERVIRDLVNQNL